jgi:hypothetical protein
VEADVEEARKLVYDLVGDESFPLGGLAVDDGTAVEALSSLEVSLEATREEEEGFFVKRSRVSGSP